MDEELNSSNESVSVSGRDTATTEGLLCAYISLLVMAVVPIYVASRRSIVFHESLKLRGEAASEKITAKDAAMFPLYASAGLFGLYIVFRYLSKEYVNLLLNLYFYGLGVGAMTRVTSLCAEYIAPQFLSQLHYYTLMLDQHDRHSNKKELFKTRFNAVDIGLLVVAMATGVAYIITKHWLLNNTFGISFAFTAIELISLQSISVGCILLSGLFVYDVFWVFGTDVMVTVAKSFEAPIKLLFPMDFLSNGIYGSNFSLLGLGDIVLPGILIALLCRYDARTSKGQSYFYFHISLASYFLGLLTTILVMHVFNAAQPALLYIVPCCLGIPLCSALLKGDFNNLWSFEDYPEAKPEQESVKSE